MDQNIFLNNQEKGRYELHVENQIAFVEYKLAAGDIVVLTHTSVPQKLSGKGIGSQMVEKVFEDIEKSGKKVNPLCPFTRGCMEKNPKWKSLHFTYK